MGPLLLGLVGAAGYPGYAVVPQTSRNEQPVRFACTPAVDEGRLPGGNVGPNSGSWSTPRGPALASDLEKSYGRDVIKDEARGVWATVLFRLVHDLAAVPRTHHSHERECARRARRRFLSARCEVNAQRRHATSTKTTNRSAGTTALNTLRSSSGRANDESGSNWSIISLLASRLLYFVSPTPGMFWIIQVSPFASPALKAMRVPSGCTRTCR